MNEQMAANRARRMADVNLHGTDLFGEAVEKKHTSKLGDEFLIPPFSVLSAREGWWQERKRAWLSLGIQSELGRGEELIVNGGGHDEQGEIRQVGLTWGNSPQVTEKGLNFYRKQKKTSALLQPKLNSHRGKRGIC